MCPNSIPTWLTPSTIRRSAATRHVQLRRLGFVLLETQLGHRRCPRHIEVHRLLPPKLAGARPASPLARGAKREDGPIDDESRDRLPPHQDVLCDGAHSDLFQHVLRRWIRPYSVTAPPGLIDLRQSVGCPNMETLEPHHRRWCYVPRLTPE